MDYFKRCVVGLHNYKHNCPQNVTEHETLDEMRERLGEKKQVII